jgi:hypothetical protein
MNFWQFLDRQLARLNPSAVAGAGIFVLTGIVLLMLSNDRTLADNDLFKTLAQAIIVQGLVGLAMAAWFTKKADEGPTETRIINKADDPVSVDQQEEQ